jgi:RHS repeat-associated protein
VPIGSSGALKLQQETSPLPNATISYAYDALGRTTSRTVQSSGAETFQYDAIGRLIGHASDLGSFSLSYLGQTPQIVQRQLLPVTSNLATNWTYLPNSGDRRLAGIANGGLSTSQYSNYQFTTTAENFITAITETSDTPTAYPSASAQTATYNNLNQLTNLSGQALSFDADGNLLSDGQRNYSWDAENRLVGITYPSQPGKQTTFSYDGRGRRTAITSTSSGGGGTVTTSYVWCAIRLCQARNASNSTTREYFGEGEFVPGSPVQSLFYGSDQIGSVRRVFANPSSAPSYGYDPFGNALQATAPLTDFGYAGMFYNADSGLYLTLYRAYDPVSGRWLSRDPLAQRAFPAVNLYRYGQDNPVIFDDPLGLFTFTFGFTGSFIAGSGVTGGVGVYVTNQAGYGGWDIGVYTTQGTGTGLDIGGGVQVGYTPGDVSNFGSPTTSCNAGAGPFTGSTSNTGGVSGTYGYGAPFTLSTTHTTTRTQGIVDDVLGPMELDLRRSTQPGPFDW